MDRPILIVEDSENIATRLKEFVEKVGCKNIHIEKEPNMALEKFREIGKNNSHPIVFLDYEIADSCGLSLLSRLIAEDTDGEVVILSSVDRNSQTITRLINEGAYEILQKPIRFDDIKNVINIIQIESEDSSQFKIDELLKTTNRMSELWLAENSGLAKQELDEQINKWIRENKIVQVKDIEDVCCPNCSSVKTGHVFHCPKCKNSDFVQANVIEHYECGNVDLEKKFTSDKCPSCKKELKALGVDFRLIMIAERDFQKFHVILFV